MSAREHIRIDFTIFGDPVLIERFEARFIPEPITGCYLWLGAPCGKKKTSQYGLFRVGRGRQIRAHRAAWLLYRGPIPDGMDVLHTCDNPPCVNPLHLFTGTNADNVADRVKKGRSGWEARPGEAHPLARLTTRDVCAIRERFARGETGKALACEFRVCRATVSEIVTRRKWKSVP